MTIMEAYEDMERKAGKVYEERKRQWSDKTQITLQLGICSMSVQAREVYRIFEDLGRSRSKGSVVLLKTGCAGLCSLEPLVEVEVPGCEPVWYYHVTPVKAELIYLNHIEKGNIIVPWTLRGREVE